MLAMQALWANDVASFDGEFIQFTPSWQWPKPVQQPRPRTLIGGAAGPKLFKALVEYADGWMPIGGAGITRELDQLRELFREAGRDESSLHIVPTGVVPSEEKLSYFALIGVTEAVLRLPSADREAVLPVLDEFSSYIDRF
jgi:alkanesulfonate monooxygenase SsuD/methylene tetrahydromethanopterin reductase-like flavin-dependent oxidoreductase (luciferase family)